MTGSRWSRIAGVKVASHRDIPFRRAVLIRALQTTSDGLFSIMRSNVTVADIVEARRRNEMEHEARMLRPRA
jgi:hypothetical protein